MLGGPHARLHAPRSAQVDEFDEAETRRRLAEQAGVHPDSIVLNVKSGSVIVTATIRVSAPEPTRGGRRASLAAQRWQRYARVARSMDKLLNNPEGVSKTFGLPLRRVDTQPTISREAPGKLEGKALQQAVESALVAAAGQKRSCDGATTSHAWGHTYIYAWGPPTSL